MNAPEHSADALEWLRRAREDIRWARHSYDGRFLPQACFACQQAVEKALKSFLLAHDQPLERTHSLPRLLSLCEPYASELTRFEDSITELDVYYAPTRYADVGQAIDYTESRIERALAGAEEVLDVLASRIEARLHDSEMKSDD